MARGRGAQGPRRASALPQPEPLRIVHTRYLPRPDTLRPAPYPYAFPRHVAYPYPIPRPDPYPYPIPRPLPLPLRHP